MSDLQVYLAQPVPELLKQSGGPSHMVSGTAHVAPDSSFAEETGDAEPWLE